MNRYLRPMQKPLVSILIPFKNTEAYLSECLDSILQQTYSNWEVVIVNDHSTDRSNYIVKNYAEKDARIRLFQNKNSGIIEAMRIAFKNSNGIYITRMDSDDIMTPNRIETQCNSLEKSGKQHIAVGQVKYFAEGGVSDGFYKYEQWLNTLTSTAKNYSEIYKECVIPSPCWMVHREDLIACNAFNPNRYPEDYDLTFRFYEQGLKCIPCNEILLHWRDYPVRTSRTHEHYAENHFLDLKLHYFLKLDYNNSRDLVVWGAGTKGKKAAQILIEKRIIFVWICDNPKKIGKHIYIQELKPFQFLKTLNNPQSIVTVANQDAQTYIKNYFYKLNKYSMVDYFFFC